MYLRKIKVLFTDVYRPLITIIISVMLCGPAAETELYPLMAMLMHSEPILRAITEELI